MINIHSFLLLFFLTFISCNFLINDDCNHIVQNNNKIVEIDSNNYDKYVESFDGVFFIFSDYLDSSKLDVFESKIVNLPLKENDFDAWYKIKSNSYFFPLDSFSLGDYFFTLKLYVLSGENDSQILNIRIDSYNNKCEPIDALLLNQKFTFEIEYYRKFKISKDIITITYFKVDWFDYDENGEINWNIEKENPKIDSITVIYKIDNKTGMFTKL